MITLLIGKKGSGKTKRLIASATEAIASTKGNVVVLEKGSKLTYEISHKARLIDTDEYKIDGKKALYGFISGICAGNYDVSDIFIDSTLKIIGAHFDELEVLIAKAYALGETTETNFTFSISADEDEIPESIKKYIG